MHEHILEALVQSAKELLHSKDVPGSLPKVLELIGRATDVDRVHLLMVDSSGPLDARHVVDHYVWTTPGISTPALFQDAARLRFADVGLRSWLPRLARGEVIAGNTRDFEQSEREFLEIGGIRSTVAVPVFVDAVWWGLIAFDVCQSERDWQPEEINTFRILAELVGAAVARAQRLQSLVDANRIIENSPIVIFRVAPRSPFPLTFLSQNIRQYGYEAADFLAAADLWPKRMRAEDVGKLLSNFNAIAAGECDHNRLDFRFERRNGAETWFAGEGVAQRDGAGRLTAIEGVLTDITERKHAAETLASLARTDSLTGLANRPAFLERLRLAFARARRGGDGFAVHYLDLDHFKDVNDTLGHPAGDMLLRAVATRLENCVREVDLVSRFGGDEFAILQEDVKDVGGIEGLATKIAGVLSPPFTIGGNQIRVTASIGIVRYDDGVEDPEAILTKADLALYRAKAEGRNRYRFHVAELDQQAQERVTLGSDLHLAIERGEFELFYQPQVEFASGRVVGLEALIRWNHPVRGRLLPSLFIPIAESNGTILAINRWVIESACRQMRAWRDRGIAPAIVAVNVSAIQFQSEGELDRVVADAMTGNGIAAGELELEFTESTLIESTRRHKDVFGRLREMGVRTAIDDFGTGFSSLAYLSAFRITRLKLAIEFVHDVTTNPENAAIVRATIGLARQLGIELMAEGVNTAEQQAFLLAAGCEFGQGFNLGEPASVEQTTEILRKNAQARKKAAVSP